MTEKYETYTDPRKIRPGNCKHRMFQIFDRNSDDEMAVYEANARDETPVKEKTIAGWLCYWRWWKENKK